MLSFKELNESFNKAAPWRKFIDKPRELAYKWKIDGHEYELVAENTNIELDLWEITFTIENPKAKGTHTTDATGTGNEMAVFATVLEIIFKDVIPTANPQKVYFSAEKADNGKDNNRSRLYGKLIKRYLPKGWSLKETSSAKRVDFFLIRK